MSIEQMNASWVAAMDKALNGMMGVRMHARYEEDKEFAIRFTAIWFELIEKKRLAQCESAVTTWPGELEAALRHLKNAHEMPSSKGGDKVDRQELSDCICVLDDIVSAERSRSAREKN